MTIEAPTLQPTGLQPVGVPAASPAPAVVPQLPPAQPPQTLEGSALPQPPNTIVAPGVPSTPNISLEEQAQNESAATQAAQQAATTPRAGDDVALPAAFGSDWEGKSAADLMQSLKDTQAALTRSQQAQALAVPQVPTTTPPAGPAAAPVAPPGQAPAPPQAQPAELTPGTAENFNAYVASYASTFQAQGGQLTPEQVTAFSKGTGTPEHFVSRSIENEMIRTERDADQVYGDIGGKENYGKLVQWLQGHVDPRFGQQFDASLESNDLDRIRTTTSAMWSAYQQSGGGPPEFISAAPAGGPGGAVPFRNQTEVGEFLNKTNPQGTRLMDLDPGYRQEYERRMAASPNPYG